MRWCKERWRFLRRLRGKKFPSIGGVSGDGLSAGAQSAKVDVARRGGCNEVAKPTINYSQGCCNSQNHPVRLRRPPLRWRGIFSTRFCKQHKLPLYTHYTFFSADGTKCDSVPLSHSTEIAIPGCSCPSFFTDILTVSTRIF